MIVTLLSLINYGSLGQKLRNGLAPHFQLRVSHEAVITCWLELGERLDEAAGAGQTLVSRPT